MGAVGSTGRMSRMVLVVKVRVWEEVIRSRNRDEDIPGDGDCLSQWKTNKLLTLDQ